MTVEYRLESLTNGSDQIAVSVNSSASTCVAILRAESSKSSECNSTDLRNLQVSGNTISEGPSSTRGRCGRSGRS